MTVENRLIIGLGDIRAVTLECSSCEARLSLSPDKITRAHLGQCPSCRTYWMSDTITQGQHPTSLLSLFLLTLGPARHTQQNGSDSKVAVRVFFEIDVTAPLSSASLPLAAQ